MDVRDLCYQNFSWFGERLSRVFKGLENDLDAAAMKVHPDVYMSVIAAGAIATLIVPIILLSIYLAGLWPDLSMLPINGLILIPASLLLPLVVIVFGIMTPKTGATNRISGLKTEIPYASMYISVMASGGLSPFESLMRLRGFDLLPQMQKEVERIETIALSTGVDPVTAIEMATKQVNISEYNELLLGYASSLRTGGDTMHYLLNQTQNMFLSLGSRMKAMGENIGMLMETYTIIGILGVLGIFLVFVIGLSLPMAGVSISPEMFFLFSFIFMPFLSIVFIYASDAAQISYPISNFKIYLMFLCFLPFGIFLGTQLVLPFFDKSFIMVPELPALVSSLRVSLGFAEGTEAPIGLGIVLIFISLPGAILDYVFIERDKSIQYGVVQFLRDLVETRKSGLSPEKCIDALSNRNYQGFSSYLKMINLKLNWGYPIRQIYGEFRGKVKNWLALMNVYLFIDTLDVGGGSIESLESLASFAETSKRLEDEKKALLMPLVVVPYIGAAMLVGTTVMFMSFFAGQNMGISVPVVELYRTLLTPLCLHAFTLGLVTGKMTSGRVSAGFKHAIMLMIVSMLGIYAVAFMGTGGMVSS
jgi:archaeal flagellar protein FlaJ